MGLGLDWGWGSASGRGVGLQGSGLRLGFEFVLLVFETPLNERPYGQFSNLGSLLGSFLSGCRTILRT